MTKEKCAVCANEAKKQVTVIYSESPFGQDSDTVSLCDYHLEEAKNLYTVK